MVENAAEAERFDFAPEFAVKLPAGVFLVNFGVEPSSLPRLLEYKDWFVREGLASEDSPARWPTRPNRCSTFSRARWTSRRSEGFEGRRDVISQLLAGNYKGRPLTDDEIVNASFMSMMASLDTTTSALNLSWLTLAAAAGSAGTGRQRARPDPEDCRRTDPVPTGADDRRGSSRRKVELAGVTMRPGDKVLMSWGMAGRDPEAYERADECWFERPAHRTLAFGVGPHRCLGMHLARRIIAIALQEWHSRIPNYRLDPDSPPISYYSPVRGVMTLPLLIGGE